MTPILLLASTYLALDTLRQTNVYPVLKKLLNLSLKTFTNLTGIKTPFLENLFLPLYISLATIGLLALTIDLGLEPGQKTRYINPAQLYTTFLILLTLPAILSFSQVNWLTFTPLYLETDLTLNQTITASTLLTVNHFTVYYLKNTENEKQKLLKNSVNEKEAINTCFKKTTTILALTTTLTILVLALIPVTFKVQTIYQQLLPSTVTDSLHTLIILAITTIIIAAIAVTIVPKYLQKTVT